MMPLTRALQQKERRDIQDARCIDSLCSWQGSTIRELKTHPGLMPFQDRLMMEMHARGWLHSGLPTATLSTCTHAPSQSQELGPILACACAL